MRACLSWTVRVHLHRPCPCHADRSTAVADVHFQYNGFLLGVLLLSLAAAWRVGINAPAHRRTQRVEQALMHPGGQGQPLRSAVLFATLLNLKHLYLVCAPAFFVFLLRTHCVTGPPCASASWGEAPPALG
jgi:alpha-1,3-glucosyltransferase